MAFIASVIAFHALAFFYGDLALGLDQAGDALERARTQFVLDRMIAGAEALLLSACTAWVVFGLSTIAWIGAYYDERRQAWS